MAQVKFVTCTAAQFATAAKDEGTLYFVSDERRIYRGSVPFSGGIYKAVTSFPATAEAERNVLYTNTATGAVKYFDGSAFIDVVLPKATAITTGSASEIATTKAVADYVTAEIKKVNGTAEGLGTRLTAVEAKATQNATDIATNAAAIEKLNGSGEGSVAAAVKAAKEEAINTAANDATKKASAAQTTAEKIAADNLATAKSDLEAEIAKKANSADVYTKDEADTKIADAVANAHHLKREIVAALPAVEEANEDTIYMVPKIAGIAGNADGNVYIEYMLVNGKFEQIGDSTVDLTDYAKTKDVEGLIRTVKTEAADDAAKKVKALADGQVKTNTDAITKLNSDSSVAGSVDAKIAAAKSTIDGSIKDVKAIADANATKLETVQGTGDGSIEKAQADAVAEAKDYTDSLAKNYATAAQGEKADTALQDEDIKTGTADGTIAVKNVDVAVAGLKSAAFTLATDYDKAGAANTALNSAKTYADKQLEAANTYTDTALTWGTL